MDRAAVLACVLLGACHSSSDDADSDGGPCDFSDTACDAPDAQLAACAAPATGGVYGTQTVVVVERPGPGVVNGPQCGSTFSVNVFVDDGSDAGPPFPGQFGDAGPSYVEVPVRSHDGYYSASLGAGTYWLCCTYADPRYPTCSKVPLGAGEVVRYDLGGSVSVGGTPCSFTKR